MGLCGRRGGDAEGVLRRGGERTVPPGRRRGLRLMLRACRRRHPAAAAAAPRPPLVMLGDNPAAARPLLRAGPPMALCYTSALLVLALSALPAGRASHPLPGSECQGGGKGKGINCSGNAPSDSAHHPAPRPPVRATHACTWGAERAPPGSSRPVPAGGGKQRRSARPGPGCGGPAPRPAGRSPSPGAGEAPSPAAPPSKGRSLLLSLGFCCSPPPSRRRAGRCAPAARGAARSRPVPPAAPSCRGQRAKSRQAAVSPSPYGAHTGSFFGLCSCGQPRPQSRGSLTIRPAAGCCVD